MGIFNLQHEKRYCDTLFSRCFKRVIALLSLSLLVVVPGHCQQTIYTDTFDVLEANTSKMSGQDDDNSVLPLDLRFLGLHNELSITIYELSYQYNLIDFDLNSDATLFTEINSVKDSDPSMLQLSLKLQAKTPTETQKLHTYSVLMGFGMSDKVEMNIGFSSLDDDTRLQQTEFYEGTWYAGFSGRF